MSKYKYNYIKFFDDVRKEDVALVGGKNSSLGELLSFDVPVPLGFAVTAKAFDLVLDENYFLIDNKKVSLRDYIRKDIQKISEEVKKDDIKSIQEVDRICANI